MNSVIIDSDKYQASGVKAFLFPGGEPHAIIPRFEQPVLFYLKARTWNDVGFGACVWDALIRQYNDSLKPQATPPKLFMPYSPGARQDRSDGTAPVTKGLIAGLFAANKGIHVFDIHSDLHSYNWRPVNWLPRHLRLPQRPDVDFVIIPDKGAKARAEDFADTYCPNAKLIQASKERNSGDGKLFNYQLPPLPREGTYLVVDDICDGGATFVLLAEAFRKDPNGAQSRLELFVSHGIFSKGPDLLLDQYDNGQVTHRRYDHIFTTDSFWNWQYIKTVHRCSHMTVYPLQPIIERIVHAP